MDLKKEDKKEAVKFIIENYYKFGNINIDLEKIIDNMINYIEYLKVTEYNKILSIMT